MRSKILEFRLFFAFQVMRPKVGVPTLVWIRNVPALAFTNLQIPHAQGLRREFHRFRPSRLTFHQSPGIKGGAACFPKTTSTHKHRWEQPSFPVLSALWLNHPPS